MIEQPLADIGEHVAADRPKKSKAEIDRNQDRGEEHDLVENETKGVEFHPFASPQHGDVADAVEQRQVTQPHQPGEGFDRGGDRQKENDKPHQHKGRGEHHPE